MLGARAGQLLVLLVLHDVGTVSVSVIQPTVFAGRSG